LPQNPSREQLTVFPDPLAEFFGGNKDARWGREKGKEKERNGKGMEGAL